MMHRNDPKGPLRAGETQWTPPTDMPLFPLQAVLFPGMMMPLHIFEPRYIEMVERCLAEKIPFGVALIRRGQEVGGSAEPHLVGTAARITRVQRHPDGRMDIVVAGTQRFRIEELDHSRPYLVAQVRHYPVINGNTRLAMEQALRVRPKIVRYVETLTKATGVKLPLDQLPEDPTILAFLTAIALQVPPADKQRLLALPGVPEILDLENYFLARELQLLDYMVESQPRQEKLVWGPTGYLFAN